MTIAAIGVGARDVRDRGRLLSTSLDARAPLMSETAGQAPVSAVAPAKIIPMLTRTMAIERSMKRPKRKKPMLDMTSPPICCEPSAERWLPDLDDVKI